MQPGFAVIDLFKSPNQTESMKPDIIRTSIDLPRDLHRQIHEAAARQGCSARRLILRGIEHAVQSPQANGRKRRLRLDPPPIRPAGRHIDLTNDRIYELIELP